MYDGGSRSDGARAGGVGLQTFRDWVLRFNAAGPTGLVDGKAPGQAPRLDQAQRDELARLIEDGPVPAVHGVVRWRLSDLAQWVMERYRTSVSEQTLSRYLRTMGYRKLSARPRHHAQNPEAVSAFKKTSLNVWQRSRLAMHRASRERSVFRTKPGSARRTRSHAAGPSAAAGRRRRPTNARNRRTSSARSAPSAASAQAWYCRGATTRRWACTSTRFRRPFRRVRTP